LPWLFSLSDSHSDESEKPMTESYASFCGAPRSYIRHRSIFYSFKIKYLYFVFCDTKLNSSK
jgi:hypothetical protein